MILDEELRRERSICGEAVEKSLSKKSGGAFSEIIRG
jgi:hypothetical protein